jgi:uncharacterized membrane protein YedE/YeeE
MFLRLTLIGLLFSVGLGISGMTNPNKVLGFLDLFGNWDPSLALVMVSAMAVYGTAYRLIRKRAQPMFAERLLIPTRRDLSPRLVGGSLVFGAGWGLAGFCPGPGLVTLGGGAEVSAVFVVSMLGGMLLWKIAESRWIDQAPPATLEGPS